MEGKGLQARSIAARVGTCLVLALPLILGLAGGALAGRDVLYSIYPDDAERFRAAIRDGRSRARPPVKGPVAGGIVTHHFLASRLMVEFFEGLVSGPPPSRIVLIGPDHAGVNPRGVSVSTLDWRTPFGLLTTDGEAVRRVREALRLPGDDSSAFFREHSIGILVPFIHAYFPEVRIIPVMVSGRASPRMRQALGAALAPMMTPETLVILSMDFSHGQSTQKSLEQDRVAMDVISRGDVARVRDLDVDCRTGLELMLRLFKGRSVVFGTRSDSEEESGVPADDCTSYVTAWFLRH